jgi:hypothetical protein
MTNNVWDARTRLCEERSRLDGWCGGLVDRKPSGALGTLPRRPSGVIVEERYTHDTASELGKGEWVGSPFT